VSFHACKLCASELHIHLLTEVYSMLTCVITLIQLTTCIKVFITLLYSCNGSQSVYARSGRISRSNPIGRYVGVSIGSTTYWRVIIRTTTLLC